MKPFDPNAKCPKCGFTDILVHYEKNAHLTCPDWPARVSEEHFDRHCLRCHFGWTESCVPEQEKKDDKVKDEENLENLESLKISRQMSRREKKEEAQKRNRQWEWSISYWIPGWSPGKDCTAVKQDWQDDLDE